LGHIAWLDKGKNRQEIAAKYFFAAQSQINQRLAHGFTREQGTQDWTRR
jgi:hypothetical protein